MKTLLTTIYLTLLTSCLHAQEPMTFVRNLSADIYDVRVEYHGKTIYNEVMLPGDSFGFISQGSIYTVYYRQRTSKCEGVMFRPDKNWRTFYGQAAPYYHEKKRLITEEQALFRKQDCPQV